MKLVEKAVALDPRDSLPYRMLSRIHLTLGQNDRAIEADETAVALSPSDPTALINLAFSLAFASRGDEAVRYAETAIRLNPHAPQWFYPQFLGYAYFASKRFDKAAQAFERSRRINRKNVVPIRWLAATYGQLGKMEQARTSREAFMKRRPGYSIRSWMKRSQMKGEIKELYMEGLRKAGFPE